MLPELLDLGKEATLIMNSGIQFIDFGLTIDWKDKAWQILREGQFVYTNNEQHTLRRLLFNERIGEYYDASNPNKVVSSTLEVNSKDSFNLLNGIWLPVPFLRRIAPDHFDEGPLNWVRVRVIELDSPDEEGHTHRVTFAFDTKVFTNNPQSKYLAPTEEDVSSGVMFALTHQANHMSWFLELPWINEWLLEVFNEQSTADVEDKEEEIKQNFHQAHYLNLLAVLGQALSVPTIKVISNKSDDVSHAIPVDMILDIGNSRTCGILIEDHGQDQSGLKIRYELTLRDLTHTEHVYNEPFESRIEFAQAVLGKDHFSVKSGRRDAFQWATIGRVGKEANRLAGRRNGNEGSTGLSSPKRYLWDKAQYEQGWRFNTSYVKTDHEPYATAEPLAGLVNEYGEALHSLSDDIEEEFERKIPVYRPKYSRSSLMTFMLTEVFMHALIQINNPVQRSKLNHSRTPRYLRSVILTMPPAMPKPEQAIFKDCVYQALGLLWKSLGWDMSDDDFDFDDEQERKKYWPYLPEVIVQWDEATCGQVVYFYNETQNNYGGRPEEFIQALRRQDSKNPDGVRIATIDIGGGTTDLVINHYSLDYGLQNRVGSSNAFITPEQCFRDGFKVAGDDILLDLIRFVLVDSMEEGLKARGLKNANFMLSKLLGSQNHTVQNELLRQQLTLQIFVPAGLRLLKEYEEYDPYNTEHAIKNFTLKELIDHVDPPSEEVLAYINHPISKELGDDNFNILDLSITLNLKKIHSLFFETDENHYNISKTLRALCEIINDYQCDMLLLTGRPSRLPGIQAFFRASLSLPVARILPLHNYRTGTWYPFHKQGRIDDPKTTAAVGAMLCFLSKNQRLPNFNFRSKALIAYSTVKYFGMLDNNNVIKSANVFYDNINLDDPEFEFPEDSFFEVRGSVRLGFRQLNAERWNASPLYFLKINDAKLSEAIDSYGATIYASLKVDKKGKRKKDSLDVLMTDEKRKQDKEPVNNFVIAKAYYIKPGSESQHSIRVRDTELGDSQIKLTLNTMIDAELSESSYWLDTGCIKRD